MRLTQLKLAGFKSFVEPTTIPTPSDLVGVVGPNGCGKSNIIDAVRWVMGESRASELRGESMQDVIFNGSDNRKPAARASVELIFDNSQGRAAGQWSAYTEISVRRVLTRDGKNTYYINNQVVRRRDIYDIFLGTGLGSRGYAIIGQGMINRLIEAKPEELRFYLEEAAGVSRYKERRRETENRLRDTRENLSRLEDILQELETQILRLEKQAKIASKYKDLQQQGQQKQHLLWFLREQQAQQERQTHTNQIELEQNKLEQAIANQRSIELQLEQLRQSHYRASEALHTKQGKLYEISSLVSKLETEIKHAKELRIRLQQRQTELEQQNAQWLEQINHSNEQIEEVEIQLEDADFNCAELEDNLQLAHKDNPDLDFKVTQLASDRDDLNHTINKIQQQLALKNQTIDNATRQVQNINLKIDRLQQELSNIDTLDDYGLTQSQEKFASLNDILEKQQDEFLVWESELPQLKQNLVNDTQELAQIKEQITQIQASLNALQSLQENIHKGKNTQQWLQENKLDNLQAIWQKIKIKNGWEYALESVLQYRLTALDITGHKDLIYKLINNPPSVRLSFYDLNQLRQLDEDIKNNLTLLLNLLNIESPELKTLLSSWLHGVYIADSLEEAVNQQKNLPIGTCIVLAQGHIIDASSIHFYQADSQQSGLLARQSQIEQLQKQLKAQKLFLEQADIKLNNSESSHNSCVSSMNRLRAEIAISTEKIHAVQLDISSKKQKQAQILEKTSSINSNIQELIADKQSYIEEQIGCEDALVSLNKDLIEYQQKLRTNLDATEKMRDKLTRKQDVINAIKRQQQEYEFKQRSLRIRLDELKRNLQLAKQQQEQSLKQLNSLQGELFNISESNYEQDLQQALSQRIEKEQDLKQARINLDDIATKLREKDEKRLNIEHGLQPIRESINQLQLKEQAARMSFEQFSEQLNAQNADRDQLRKTLASSDTHWHQTSWLQSEVQRISKDIETLGAVNMAALQELENALERQSFMNSQNDDLVQAINTLEDAIHNIDKETRVLLKDTFQAVNNHLGDMFPRLFGGGRAYLIITGEEILDAGVQVMAQPPGKRNSTIQLLSGGEKALTAIALVFAFFKLNPAPFCLLDEVDAPLDDANTDRYAKLVQSMSDQTQFLFISHNKIAMQMAKHLIGVTMQEQGVSRVVAVDMEYALNMAHN